MLKLYNLYEQVILEATEIEKVMDAIEKHYTVNIKYNNGKNDGSQNMKRYCEVYNFGTTYGNNNAIRVYQLSGPNGRGWKTFRLDRIVEWEPTNFKFNNPVSDRAGSDAEDFKPHDKTLSFGGGVTISNFNK
jgi:predicted DNA-binding transcriptional regulator YafY